MHSFYVAFLAVFFSGQAASQLFQFSTSMFQAHVYDLVHKANVLAQALPKARTQRITSSGFTDSSPRSMKHPKTRIKVRILEAQLLLTAFTSRTLCDQRRLC